MTLEISSYIYSKISEDKIKENPNNWSLESDRETDRQAETNSGV